MAQPQRIDVPGIGIVEFPPGMSDEQISTAIQGLLANPERQPHTLGGDIQPHRANETPEARAAREAAANRFWNETNYFQRAGTGLGHLLSAVPGVRHLPLIRDIRDAQLVRDYMRGVPDRALFGDIAGNTIPYMSGAAIAPNLMSRFIPAAIGGAVVEGGDRAIEASRTGQDPYEAGLTGAATGAAGAIPGTLLGRAITPHTPFRARRNIVDRDLSGLVEPRRTPWLDATVDAGVGGLIGHVTAGHPMIGSAIGAAVGPRVRELGRTMWDRLGYSRAGQRVDDTVFRYLNNQVISPQNQALLNALSLGAIGPVTDSLNYDPTMSLTGR